MYILNYLYFIIITVFGLKFLFQKYGKVRNPLNKKQKLLFDGPELFWVLTFSTGLLAFSAPGTLDLMAIRLLVLEIFCLTGIFIVKRSPIWSPAMIFYLIYMLWLIIGLSYTPSQSYGIRVILKYLYPFIVMLFASAAVRHKEVFLKAGLGARTVAIVSIIISFTPYLERVAFLGVIWTGTARSINYISICVFSLALFYHAGRKKKDLYLAILFVIPCILWVFRTSIMGTGMALMTFFFFKYKTKSLPIILGILLLFIAAIFTIPSIKEKMFFSDEGKSISQLQEGKISMVDINTNGRFAMWEWSLKKYYHNKELIGTGTGNLQEVFYSLKHPFGSIRISHNDYVQILCDNGLIGIVLFGCSFLIIIFHSFFVYQNKKYPICIRICAITAGASTAGVLLTLYTDNVINYSMATISYPCGFYGIMLGLMKGYQQTKNVIQHT